jgi:hypothetical protein
MFARFVLQRIIGVRGPLQAGAGARRITPCRAAMTAAMTGGAQAG